MSHSIETYENFENRITDLKCLLPDVLSFLPENLDDATKVNEFIYSDSITDLRKIFKSNNIQTEFLSNEIPKFRLRKNADWFGPAFFIAFSMLTENKDLITVALNVLSNYVTDLFKGSFSTKTAKLEIVVEISKNKEYRRIKYEGSPEGIKDLPKIINSLK